jgi:hypothetical protein
MTNDSMNYEIITSNLREAIEELEKLHRSASEGNLDEEKLQVGLLHAYHHINFAWNIRRVPTSRYTALSSENFDLWGSYPSDIEL